MASTSSTANATATKQLIIAAKVERAIEYKPRGTVGPVVKVLKLIKAVVTVAEDVVRVVETVGAELKEAVELIGAHERMSNVGSPPEKRVTQIKASNMAISIPPGKGENRRHDT